jgi:hypothetical protein
MTESNSNNPYARFLGDLPLNSILTSSSAKLASLVSAIGAEGRLDLPLAPGKWTPAQILCHLADCELAFGFRLRQALAEEHHVLQPFDQDKWAATYAGISAEQGLLVFQTIRGWNLMLVKNAPPDAYTRVVTHPERGTMTFQTLLETMAGHDINHILQLEKLAVQG